MQFAWAAERGLSKWTVQWASPYLLKGGGGGVIWIGDPFAQVILNPFAPWGLLGLYVLERIFSSIPNQLNMRLSFQARYTVRSSVYLLWAAILAEQVSSFVVWRGFAFSENHFPLKNISILFNSWIYRRIVEILLIVFKVCNSFSGHCFISFLTCIIFPWNSSTFSWDFFNVFLKAFLVLQLLHIILKSSFLYLYSRHIWDRIPLCNTGDVCRRFSFSYLGPRQPNNGWWFFCFIWKRAKN